MTVTSTKRFIDTTDETISMYLKEVRKIDMLTPEQEIELTFKISNGDEKALETLIKSNLRFVISVAKDYQGQGLPLSDLINEGNLGLIKAAEKFDHTKGFRFISYAVWWVRQSIIQSLNDLSRTVRLPVNITNEMTKVKKEMEKFEQSEGRKATDSDMDLSVMLQPTCSSLNQTINEDGDEIIDLIEDTSLMRPAHDHYSEILLKQELEKTLSVLSDRERKIIEMYFGIDGQPMTLEQIGEEFNLTKERVRQIKVKSLRRLKDNCFNLTEFMSK